METKDEYIEVIKEYLKSEKEAGECWRGFFSEYMVQKGKVIYDKKATKLITPENLKICKNLDEEKNKKYEKLKIFCQRNNLPLFC